MKRLLAFVVVTSLGHASTGFAGESILSAGSRHAQALAATSAPSPSARATSDPRPQPTVAIPSTGYQGSAGTLSKSGMSKGKKTLLYLGLAVGVAASIWTIDHNVLDVTPSSLGTRQD